MIDIVNSASRDKSISPFFSTHLRPFRSRQRHPMSRHNNGRRFRIARIHTTLNLNRMRRFPSTSRQRRQAIFRRNSRLITNQQGGRPRNLQRSRSTRNLRQTSTRNPQNFPLTSQGTLSTNTGSLNRMHTMTRQRHRGTHQRNISRMARLQRTRMSRMSLSRRQRTTGRQNMRQNRNIYRTIIQRLNSNTSRHRRRNSRSHRNKGMRHNHYTLSSRRASFIRSRTMKRIRNIRRHRGRGRRFRPRRNNLRFRFRTTRSIRVRHTRRHSRRTSNSITNNRTINNVTRRQLRGITRNTITRIRRMNTRGRRRNSTGRRLEVVKLFLVGCVIIVRRHLNL